VEGKWSDEAGRAARCSAKRNARFLRYCVLSCGILLFGTLVERSLKGITIISNGRRNAAAHQTLDRSTASHRRQGSGSVRCLVSLTATTGDLVASTELATIFTKNFASSISAATDDVLITSSQSRSASILDLGLKLMAGADDNTAELARKLHKQVDDGKLSEALQADGLAITAAFRSHPQPFSAAGLPDIFHANDQADAVLICSLLVPMIILLPALVFVILHYQLIERFVSPRPNPQVRTWCAQSCVCHS
jgi:hypothetical protein